MSTWLRLGVEKPLAVAYIGLWGPGGTLGARTTVGVTAGAPVSTWPGSRRLSALTQRSLKSAQGRDL